MSKIVPFGRYRGLPVERMLDDQGYCEWLVKQDWFEKRFPSLFTVVVNLGEPEMMQTPDHNAMQAKFLEVDYRQSVLCKINKTLADLMNDFSNARRSHAPLHYSLENGEDYDGYFCIEPERNSVPVTENVAFLGRIKWGTEEYHVGKPPTKVQRERFSKKFEYKDTFGMMTTKVAFEVLGWDVKINAGVGRSISVCRWPEGDEMSMIKDDEVNVSSPDAEWGDFRTDLYLELKPHISDDYPAIMRQMKTNRKLVSDAGFNQFALVCNTCASEVVTVAQIKAFFATAGFDFLVLSEHPELEPGGL